jgi:hypothetical protein
MPGNQHDERRLGGRYRLATAGMRRAVRHCRPRRGRQQQGGAKSMAQQQSAGESGISRHRLALTQNIHRVRLAIDESSFMWSPRHMPWLL